MAEPIPMRALPLLLLALVASAPSAAALGGGTILMQLTPVDRDLHPGEHFTITGTATLVTDLSTYAATSGVPVQYAVTKAPAWATVTLQPATDVFPPDPLGSPVGASTSHRIVLASVAIDPTMDPRGHVADVIEITAIARTPVAEARGIARVPLMVDTGAAPCPAGSLATQGAEATPLTVAWQGVAMLAAAGVALLAALRVSRGAAALALLAGAGLVAPPAQAMGGGTISWTPFSLPEPLAPGNVTSIVSTLTLYADASSYAGVMGVPYVLTVTKAPAWAIVVVQQPTGFFFNPTPDPSALGAYVSRAPTTVTILVPDGNQTTPTGPQVVELTAMAPVGLGEATGRIAFPVSFAGAPTRCVSLTPQPQPQPQPSPQRQPQPEPQPSSPLIHQQTSSATAISAPGYAVVAGCAVAGAGLGLALSRRSRR